MVIELYIFLLALMFTTSSALALPLPEGPSRMTRILLQRDLDQEFFRRESGEYLFDHDDDGLEPRALLDKFKNFFSRKGRQADQEHPARDNLFQRAKNFVNLKRRFTRNRPPSVALASQPSPGKTTSNHGSGSESNRISSESSPHATSNPSHPDHAASEQRHHVSSGSSHPAASEQPPQDRANGASVSSESSLTSMSEQGHHTDHADHRVPQAESPQSRHTSFSSESSMSEQGHHPDHADHRVPQESHQSRRTSVSSESSMSEQIHPGRVLPPQAAAGPSHALEQRRRLRQRLNILNSWSSPSSEFTDGSSVLSSHSSQAPRPSSQSSHHPSLR